MSKTAERTLCFSQTTVPCICDQRTAVLSLTPMSGWRFVDISNFLPGLFGIWWPNVCVCVCVCVVCMWLCVSMCMWLCVSVCVCVSVCGGDGMNGGSIYLSIYLSF